MIAVAPTLALIDKPDERRIHHKPIPRSGGLGVFVTMVTGVLLLKLTGIGYEEGMGGRWLWHFLGSSLLLTTIGCIDDRVEVSATGRNNDSCQPILGYVGSLSCHSIRIASSMYACVSVPKYPALAQRRKRTGTSRARRGSAHRSSRSRNRRSRACPPRP